MFMMICGAKEVKYTQRFPGNIFNEKADISRIILKSIQNLHRLTIKIHTVIYEKSIEYIIYFESIELLKILFNKKK